MKIGIISDSHGKDTRLKVALELLEGRGAEAIVHCGDIGSIECVEELGKSGLPCWGVLGNMDWRVKTLRQLAQQCGMNLEAGVVEVPLANGAYLVATHGNDEALLGELILGGQFPYVCHGHTHCRRDDRYGKTRVINPGALHHAVVHSIAILDTTADKVEFIEIAD